MKERRANIQKLIQENNIKSLDDFNQLMKSISKEILETLLEGEMTQHLGYQKHDYQGKKTRNSRNG